MPKFSKQYVKTSLVSLLCASVAVTPVWAQTPVINLSDLVNQDSNYAQRELRSRGYVFIHTDQRGTKLWQYWWQNNESVCARVAHVDGQATSIVSVSPTDCNQQVADAGQTAPASQQSGDMSTGAKVAIGAAAILGVAALLHRSHERDEQKHKSAQDVAEYERGYRDGLYHQPYHDYNRSQAYVDGYNAGQQKRDADTSYRSSYGHHTGSAAYVNLNDLVGARGSSVDSAMSQRGFRSTGGYQSEGRAHSTWWNPSTRQCVNLVTSGGRLQSVSPIAEGNCT